MDQDEKLIPKHGGYRRLKTFQLSELIYDVTVRFCDAFIERSSRTRDQMTQAARSGRQNIAEGSQASGTSRKMEMKLTGVARASLEELRLDYEDYLRQHGLEPLASDSPALLRFKGLRCRTLAEVQAWVKEERRLAASESSEPSVPVRVSPRDHSLSAILAASAALSLLNLCCHLLDRQLESQAATFEREGGFTERLYRRRVANRSASAPP